MSVLVGLLWLGAMISGTLLAISLPLLPIRKWRPKTGPLAKYSALGVGLAVVALVVAPSPPDASKTGGDLSGAPAKVQEPPVVPGKPGRAKICLISDELKFDTYSEITIPATAIFSSRFNAHAKIPGDPTRREQEPQKPGRSSETPDVSASFITASAVTLTKTSPCAEVEVRLYVGRGSNAEIVLAADNRIFDLDDIIDYPIPEKKPPVEFGKLSDDMSVTAVLTADVSEVVRAPADPDEAASAAECLQGATDLARYMGAKVGPQTSQIVEIEQTGAGDVSFGCGIAPSFTPDLFVSWERRARPPAVTVQFAGKAGEYMLGARADELRKELAACVEEALKPGSHELSHREFRGAKIECQAFARDGGGGSATIYRRFGAIPVHMPAPVAAMQTTPSSSSPPVNAGTCKDDWARCADNTELANNYSGMVAAKVDCKLEANDRAKYGTSEWPWLPFGSFRPGSDAPRTGIIVIAEPDAKFSNQFGAMVHVTVRCTYDLRAKRVVDVSIDERQ